MSVRIVKVIFQTYLPTQGRFPRVSGQAKILRDAGFDVTILACDRDGTNPTREVIDGITIERIRVRTGEMRGPIRQLRPLLAFWAKAFQWLRRNPFDMLHCHNLDVFPLGVAVKLAKRVPVILDAHEPDYYALWPKRWRFLQRGVDAVDTFFCRRADAVTVTNGYQIRKYERAGVRRVELIGNYPPPDLRIESLSGRERNGREITFGRLGTFYPRVGLEETITAFRGVLETHPDARFLLGGRVVDAYRQTFAELVAPCRDRLEAIGAYDARTLPRLYERIDVSCMIYPRTDWFRNITPRKFFDSMANGVPVIITDIGGLGDVVRRHDCGIVVDDQDPAAIRAAMEALAGDEALRARMARGALALAQSEYGWTQLTNRYVALVNDLRAPSAHSEARIARAGRAL